MAEASVSEPLGLKLVNKIKSIGKKPVLTKRQVQISQVERLAIVQKLANRNRQPSANEEIKYQKGQAVADSLNAATHDPIELQRVREELQERKVG